MLNISSEKYEKSKSEYEAAQNRENRRIMIASAALRLCGIVIIIGAVLIFVRPAAGIIAALSAFLLFTALCCFETSSERKFQLSHEHMIFSPDSYRTANRIKKDGYSEDTVKALLEYLEKESDGRRICRMSDCLCEALMSLGMYDEALAAVKNDSGLFDEDGFFKLIYNFRRLFCAVFSEKNADDVYEAYEVLPKEAEDHLSLTYLLYSEILMAFHEERYFDVLSLCETAFPDEEIDSTSSFYLYLKAKARYFTGKYEGSLELAQRLTGYEKNRLIKEKSEELEELLS